MLLWVRIGPEGANVCSVQVIKIMGRTLAPFASHEHGIPVFGFGDSTTGHWSVFPLNGEPEGECTDLEEVLRWVRDSDRVRVCRNWANNHFRV